jgi:hypothetical protein
MDKLLTKCLILAWVVSFTGVAPSQTNLGSIVGTVRDSTGAVVPGVVVKVINEGTAWTREFKTLPNGDYEVTNLVGW